MVAFHVRNMSIAEFACVVHFHLGKEAQQGSPSGDFHSEREEGQIVTSLVIKVLELSTGSILPPSFEFELTSQPNSGTLHEALENAEQFIEDNFCSQGRRFAVIMDTSTLDDVIAECERQDAGIPMFFSFAHDAIAAAKSVHPFESDGLGDALSACGVALSDSPAQHAACIHVARLCQFAVANGFRFPAAMMRKVTAKKVNKRAAAHTEDIASKAHAPDSKGCSDAPASQVSDASSFTAASMLPMSQYCRFRGLPYSATKADIIAFCEDIPVDEQSVHILLGPGGRPTGDAMCAATPPPSFFLDFPLILFARLMFASKSDAARAIKLNKKNMGSRYVQVFEMSQQDWLSATMGPAHHDTAVASATVTCHVVKLKGLPFSARQADIVSFFAEGGFYITEVAVVMYVLCHLIPPFEILFVF